MISIYGYIFNEFTRVSTLVQVHIFVWREVCLLWKWEISNFCLLQMYVSGRRGQLPNVIQEEEEGCDREEAQGSHKYVLERAETSRAQRLREAGVRQVGEGRDFANDCGSPQDAARQR